MLTRDDADKIVTYIQAVEELKGHHPHVVEYLKECGYTEKEIDEALKALGRIAGRDCGIL